MNLSQDLKERVQAALLAAYPDMDFLLDHTLIEITEATQEKFGHYQCNSAMKLTKLLKTPPKEIAEKIVAALKEIQEKELTTQDANHSPLFMKLEIAGPGFINVTLNPDFLAKRLSQCLQDPRLGVLLPKTPKRVVVDFSSPNVAKDMHVGHLRSTIIGDSLARILSFLGFDVLRLNHVGDWGTQFGMLIAYLKKVLPSITQDSPPDTELHTLVEWYRAAKKQFDEDPLFKKQAQEEVVQLQSGNQESLRAWHHICSISRESYNAIYDLLDIHIIERGESFYNPYLAGVIQDLEKKGLITISNGAKCVFLSDFTNREGEPLPFILQKSDGGYNYATTDLAALKHRVFDEKCHWIIYVTDAGQNQHFQMLFETAKKAGYSPENEVKLDHVPFGLVLRPDGKKFKTRSGDTERLMDLLETGIEKAKEKLLERNPDMPEAELFASAKILGINAIKYADLSSNRLSDYVFSYEKMLQFEGNTAAFLLYAYVRIQSIQRKIHVDISKLIQNHTPILLEEPAEIALGLLVCQFPDILNATAKDLLPNRLTDYLYRLAEKFHAFFHHCRVEGSPQQNSRLLLCEMVARTLNQGMLLLGLKPLSKM